MTDFRSLGVSEAVAEVLARRGIETPFQIQALVIPEALQGGDVLAKSPTGSGKTLAFAIIVGIAIGAVSTILIATPILTSLMEGDPEWARRKQYDVKPESAAAVLRSAELAAAEAPAPETPVDLVEAVVEGNGDDAAAKRERRRQRRRSRPHGRAR